MIFTIAQHVSTSPLKKCSTTQKKLIGVIFGKNNSCKENKVMTSLAV